MAANEFDFNLEEFELEFKAGKYDHLMQMLKAPKQGKVKQAKPAKKVVAVKVIKHIPQVELPVPVCLVESYITYTCKTCERKSRILNQTLIKYSLRKAFIFKAITTANRSDFKYLRSLGKEKVEWQEELLTIEMCAECTEQYFPVEEEELETTFKAFSDTILVRLKEPKIFDDDDDDDEVTDEKIE
jgi:hypothetical protein